MALAAYASEYAIPQLTNSILPTKPLRYPRPTQYCQQIKATKVLAPIEEVTKSFSADTTAVVSVIIPFVRILTKTISQNEEDR